MLKNRESKLFFSSLLLFLILGANFVFALEINYPNIPGVSVPGPGTTISDYVKYIFNLIIWIAGIIAFGGLIIGGIRYLLSAGKPEEIIAAKDQIIASFLGILILLSSFLVLKTLNPQLLIFEIPQLQPIILIQRPALTIPSPSTEKLHTLISSDIPFGTIIKDRLFETTVPQGEQKKSRMERIKDIASTTLSISEKLKQQSEDLKIATNSCSCGDAEPCCESDSKTCDDDSCSSKNYCTCDPCKKPRQQIQQLEEKNLEEIAKLVEQQKKADEEMRLLREEIGKLERAKKFLTECNDWVKNLADYLVEKGYFARENQPFRTVNFWNILPLKDDYATFFCPVSGTTAGEGEYMAGGTYLPPEVPELQPPQNTPLPPESYSGEPMSCIREMPVGEVIDRSIKTGYKLVERLETLVNLGEQMINAVDQLHVLVSQCNSHRCTSVCFRYKGKCIKACTGNPCPSTEISQQLQKIIEILEGNPQGQGGNSAKQKEGIRDVVNGPQKSNPNRDEKIREQIGINTIINEIVPKILEDLNVTVRERMKACVSDISSDSSDEEAAFEETQTLSNCKSAIKGVGPQGRIILSCCLEEPEFKECLTACYLEKGEQKYKQCLDTCLLEKSQNLSGEKAEILKNCRHYLNFYCCKS